ncbi:MAG: response regulator [Cyanobacteria bacterium P01_G01_bin.67]
MSSTANRSAKTIWVIEHSDDNIWLLELILEKWGFDTVRIKDSEDLDERINCQTNLPNLIIISIAPLQKNVFQLIAYFHQEPKLKDTPLLCLCPTGGLCEFQVMAAGANDLLNKPFELEQLHYRLQRLWGEEISFQRLRSKQEMTLLVSETESSTLVEQQQYWSKIFQEYPEHSVWQMLSEDGYEVLEQP